MTKKLWLAACVVATLGFTLWVSAQAPEKAVDPVCGMSVAKDAAKWTYAYKGTTYYFCSESCKTNFSREPEKYLAKKAEPKPMGSGTGMAGGVHGEGKATMHGQMEPGMQGGMECPMMMEGVDRQIENSKDGVIVTLTSKNPELVKKIQDHMAKMKEAMSGTAKKPGAVEGMCAGCPIKKK